MTQLSYCADGIKDVELHIIQNLIKQQINRKDEVLRLQ